MCKASIITLNGYQLHVVQNDGYYSLLQHCGTCKLQQHTYEV